MIVVEDRNMRFATELAKAHIENGFNFETVHSIQANTLGNLNSSVIVLLNCGFEKIDETDGKELGILWKW